MNYPSRKFAVLSTALLAAFMLTQAGSVFSSGTALFNNDPADRPTLRVQNFTVNGSNSTGWSTSTSASQGDVISFAIYYHNTSNEVAHDVRVRLTPQSTGVSTSHTFNATIQALNAPVVSGNVSVGISSAQSMAYVPGSVIWRPNQTVWGSQTLLSGQNGSELFTSSGLRLGDIGPGWSTQGSVVLHFKISQTQVQAPTASISANPTSITQGSSATLSWSSSNATSCFASNGWSGTKALSGSETVLPSYTTTYTMTCIGTNGQQVTQSATVSVDQIQQQLPVVTITASSNYISQGQSVVLNWNSQNATSCYASMSWWGTKSISGSETVSPVNVGANANMYRITCSNSQGSQTATAYVTVNQVQDLSVSLYANPTNVNLGNPVTLTWNSTNANSCFATNGWSGIKAMSGNEVVYPYTTTTYTITCTNTSGQQRTESVAVSVNQQQQNPTVSLNANSTQLYQGASSVLVWNSNNTNSCYGTGAWSGQKSASGSQTVTPYQTSTYTIVCTGISGLQAQTSVTVSVIPSVTPPPSTSSLIAACVPDSSVVRVGQRVEFFAGVSGGRSPYHYGWSGAASGSGVDSISASYTTTGTKIAYLQVSDAEGRSANANCSVSVLPRLVTATPPPVVPPPAVVTKTPPPPQCVYCVPVQSGQGGYPYYHVMPGQQVPVQPGVQETPDLTKKAERSVLASILLAEDGSPREGLIFLIYLFILALIVLVLYFIYSMIEASRARRNPPSLPRI